MAKPSILIIRNAYRWQDGGAEKFTSSFAQLLGQNGWQPIVVSNVPELAKRVREAGLTVKSNLWLKNRGSRRWAPLYWLLRPHLINQYRRLIKANDIKLVIAMSQDDQLYATTAAQREHVPVIWIDHADLKHTLKNPYLRPRHLKVLDYVTAIVAVSNAEKTLIINTAGNAKSNVAPKIRVIPNGAVLPQSIQPPAKPAGKFIVTFVGRLEAAKGVEEIIAAARLLQSEPRIEFWLIGKGTLEAGLRDTIKRQPELKIKLFGYQPNPANFLYSSDLFIYPTHHDAAPIAPIEALLAGLPVVASQVGGIPEVVDESCGKLIPVGDAQALATAISSLEGDPQLHQQLRTGAKTRGQQFELANIIKDQYLPLIKEVLQK